MLNLGNDFRNKLPLLLCDNGDEEPESTLVVDPGGEPHCDDCVGDRDRYDL